MTRHVDAMVAGGGRAGLAAGHHLRRKGLDFAILARRTGAGRGMTP
ncbi:cation diffusion facilitator CzcD-associated flavoprotein CzcO [Streptomyces calvus]